MRIVRALLALLTAALLGATTLSTVPAGAADLPTRIIDSSTEPKTYRSFVLSGTVEAYPLGKVLVQKKKCKGCSFKTVDKIKTTEFGSYRTKIYAPLKGKWKWRLKVNEQGGYAASYSKVYATFVK